MQCQTLIFAYSNTKTAYLKGLPEEIQLIRDLALKNAIAENYISLREHSQVTYSSLSNLLNSREGQDATMLHYSGHSSVGGWDVQWKDCHGCAGNESLVDLIEAHKKFRLVFLNSCYSYELAMALAAAGVEYVIGTTHKIKDEKAARVAVQFYKFLAVPGKTIKEAFDLTRHHFEESLSEQEQEISELFRTIERTGSLDDAYPWKIFNKDALTEEALKWCLVPERERNLVLSGSKGQAARLRVFCIYDKACGPLYETIANALTKKLSDKKIQFHGLHDISPNQMPLPEDVLAECSSADIVIHLLNDGTYREIWQTLPADLAEICRCKVNIAIAYDDNFENSLDYLKGLNIQFMPVLPEVVLGCNTIVQLKMRLRTSSLPAICDLSVVRPLEAYFLTHISGNHIDPNMLERSLYKFDFTDELSGCHISSAHPSEKSMFFILIEGTQACAQNLLYKRLRSTARIESNVKRSNIPFLSPERNIATEDDLYMALAKEMLEMNAPMQVFSEPANCIEVIASKLMSNDIVLFADDLGEGKPEEQCIRKRLICKLWNDLIRYLPSSSPNRLFIFAINRSYPSATFADLELFNRDRFKFDNIRINKLSMAEFIRWFGMNENNFPSRKFRDMYNNEYNEIIDQFRSDSINTICDKLVKSEKHSIITKILDYETYLL